MDNHTPDTPTKQCTTCGLEYPATTEYWYKKVRGKYGLYAECKECRNERTREYRRGLIITSALEGATKTCTKCSAVYPATTEYWDKHRGGKFGLQAKCKSCKAECNRLRYEANTEQILAYGRQWHEANSGKVHERQRKWRRDNPDKLRAKSRNRRALKRNAEGSHTATEVKEQFKRQKGKCHWCGCKLDGNDYHADHVIPLSKGGSNYISNIVCACSVCNRSKGAKLPHEWDGTNRLL